MSNINHKDIEKVFKTIDKALQNHCKWHDDLIRMLLCQLPLPESITCTDAHKKCEFGCWLYDEQNTHLLQMPAFKKIEKLHEIMHDGAREMSLNMKSNGKIFEDDYDYFTRNLLNFRDELTGLHERVSATMQQLKQA